MAGKTTKKSYYDKDKNGKKNIDYTKSSTDEKTKEIVRPLIIDITEEPSPCLVKFETTNEQSISKTSHKTQDKISSKNKERPTKLFISYSLQMVLRFFILLAAIILFFVNPMALSVETFGFEYGFSFLDFVFIVMIIDIATKFFPSAKISMGSLKQYKRFHVPSMSLVDKIPDKNNIIQAVKNAFEQGQIALEQLPNKLRNTFQELLSDATFTNIRNLVRNFSIRKIIPFSKTELRSSHNERKDIRKKRWKEIRTVTIFWFAFNAVIATALFITGLMNFQIALLWSLFYFLFDMVCVVLWCPLQVLFMKNRCCTTCQIFNWDAIMAATPLMFVCWQPQNMWFTLPIIVLAAIVLVRWELSFVKYPERFDETTNSSLTCANCKDRLCYIRNPLVKTLEQYTKDNS